MRLFPAQLATHLICALQLPMRRQCSVAERMTEGRAILVKITGVDYGYDLQRWHDHLKASGEGGYTWRRNIVLPKIMQSALGSNEWQEARRRLTKDIASEHPSA